MRAERQQEQQDEEGDQQLGDGHAKGIFQDRGAATAKPDRFGVRPIGSDPFLRALILEPRHRRRKRVSDLACSCPDCRPALRQSGRASFHRAHHRPIRRLWKHPPPRLPLQGGCDSPRRTVRVGPRHTSNRWIFIVFLRCRGHRRSPCLDPAITNAGHLGFRRTHRCSACKPPPHKCRSLRQRPWAISPRTMLCTDPTP